MGRKNDLIRFGQTIQNFPGNLLKSRMKEYFRIFHQNNA